MHWDEDAEPEACRTDILRLASYGAVGGADGTFRPETALIAALPGNVFDPGGTLTRAQAATVLLHAVDVN